MRGGRGIQGGEGEREGKKYVKSSASVPVDGVWVKGESSGGGFIKWKRRKHKAVPKSHSWDPCHFAIRINQTCTF